MEFGKPRFRQQECESMCNIILFTSSSILMFYDPDVKKAYKQSVVHNLPNNAFEKREGKVFLLNSLSRTRALM